jgi:hypothetical protein
MTCNTCKCNKVCDHNKYGFENCNNYISADVVEVVRCGKCKHYVFGKSYTPYCNNVMNLFEEIKPTDFCSYGERRDT